METQLHQNCYSSIGFHMSVLILHSCYKSNNLFIYVHVEMSRGFETRRNPRVNENCLE